MTGKIVLYNKDRAFGYIKNTAGGRDVFFHISDFICHIEDKESLKDAEVRFDLGANDKGPRAINIELV